MSARQWTLSTLTLAMHFTTCRAWNHHAMITVLSRESWCSDCAFGVIFRPFFSSSAHLEKIEFRHCHQIWINTTSPLDQKTLSNINLITPTPHGVNKDNTMVIWLSDLPWLALKSIVRRALDRGQTKERT